MEEYDNVNTQERRRLNFNVSEIDMDVSYLSPSDTSLLPNQQLSKSIDGTIIDSATYSETLDRISTLTQELANTQGELENIILENNDLRTQNKNLTTQISALKSLCQSMTTPNKLGTIKNSAKRLVLPQNSDASFIPSTPTSTPKSDHIYALTNLHRKISELQEQLSEASKEITCLTKQIEGLQVKLTIQKKDSTTPTQKLQTISAHEIEKKEKPADFRKIIILGAQQCVGLASALLYSRQQTQYEKYAIISETKPNALSSEIVKNYRSLNLAANDKLVISLGENDFNQKSVYVQFQKILDYFSYNQIVVLNIAKNNYLNVNKLNNTIMKICEKYKNCSYINCDKLKLNDICKSINYAIDCNDYDNKFLKFSEIKKRIQIRNQQNNISNRICNYIPKKGTIPYYFKPKTTEMSTNTINKTSQKPLPQNIGTIPYYFPVVKKGERNQTSKDNNLFRVQ